MLDDVWSVVKTCSPEDGTSCTVGVGMPWLGAGASVGVGTGAGAGAGAGVEEAPGPSTTGNSAVGAECVSG